MEQSISGMVTGAIADLPPEFLIQFDRESFADPPPVLDRQDGGIFNLPGGPALRR